MKKFFARHKRKLLIFSLFLVAGTGTYIGFQNNNPRVFNVLDYGAKGDGRRVFDAAFSGTTLTSATANFVAADVGKCVLIPNAGPSHADLPTTITGFTNSTTVTVAATASFSVSADTVNFGTDNTVAFQNAIKADSLNGGGKVFIPNGIQVPFTGPGATTETGSYMFNGPLNNGNCILHIPIVNQGAAVTRTNYVIEGETPPDWAAFADRTGDSLASHSGVTLIPITVGSGVAPSFFGTQTSGPQWNYAQFRNIKILMPRNLSGGGPTLCGINMWNMESEELYNILVAQDGSMRNTPQPSNDVAAIVMTKTGVDLLERAQQCAVIGFNYGFVYSDHFDGDNLSVEASVWAYVSSNAAYAGAIQHASIHWCQHGVYVPVTNILGGLVTPGAGFTDIGLLNIEPLTIPGSAWATMVDLINDSSNSGIGYVGYYFLIGHATNFVKHGGNNIICEQLGSFGNRLDVSGTGQGLLVDFPIGDGLSKTTNITLQSILGAGTFSSITYKGGGIEQFRNYSGNSASTYGTVNTYSGREWSLYDSGTAKYDFIVNSLDHIYIGAASYVNYGLRVDAPTSGIRTQTNQSNGHISIGDSLNNAIGTVQIYTSANNPQTALFVSNSSAGATAITDIGIFGSTGIGAGVGGHIYKLSGGYAAPYTNALGILNVDNAPVYISANSGNNLWAFGSGNTNFGGTTDRATAVVQIEKTTAQLALHYDATHDAIFTVNSAGLLTLAPTSNFSVTAHTIPTTNITYDLGTSSLAWRDIYFSHTISESAIGVSNTLGTNVTSITGNGSDEDFEVVLVTSGNVAGTLGNLTFGRNWVARPHCVISPANSSTGGVVDGVIGSYIAANATSVSNWQLVGSIIGAGTYTFNCHCGN